MKRFSRWLLLGLAFFVCSAHVGSPDAWYRGDAGPYRVLVHIQAPSVIPGTATVNVTVEDAGDVRQVTATADRFDATGGAPPADTALPVKGMSGVYRTQLWIMTGGSYKVTVHVTGARGEGSAVVPLAAVPLRRLAFSPLLGIVLALAGAVLFAGLVTIVGAAVREGTLAPGMDPDSLRINSSTRAMMVGVVVMSLVLLGGWRWWVAEDNAFERSRFKPLTATAMLRGSDVVVSITDSAWIARNRDGGQRRMRPGVDPSLVEDHGKLMHMFVVDARNGRTFVHLHPSTTDTITFVAPLPPMPPGRYAVFADMVHNSGFTHSVATTLDVPAAIAGVQSMDPDDSHVSGVPSAGVLSSLLADGSAMSWLRTDTAAFAGEEAGLRFKVTRPYGSAPLEPYMGLPGHAAVVREDAEVFVHLHPAGTISMAAHARLSGDSALAHGIHAMATDTVAFPYAFPEPGKYFIWVQVKRSGRVLTGVFETTVHPPHR